MFFLTHHWPVLERAAVRHLPAVDLHSLQVIQQEVVIENSFIGRARDRRYDFLVIVADSWRSATVVLRIHRNAHFFFAIATLAVTASFIGFALLIPNHGVFWIFNSYVRVATEESSQSTKFVIMSNAAAQSRVVGEISATF